jgi:hypothetical protein
MTIRRRVISLQAPLSDGPLQIDFLPRLIGTGSATAPAARPDRP